MKRLAVWLAVLAMVVLPMSAMAMTTVSDSELASVTGQAGVSINVDVTADISVGMLAWGDSDGFAGNATAGYVGLSGFNTTVHFSGRHDGVFAPYVTNTPITIDVAGGAAPAVKIGLPTAHLTINELKTDVFLSGADAAGVPVGAQTLGSFYMKNAVVLFGQSGFATPNGYDAGSITIMAASGLANAGVVIAADVKLESIKVEALSWGNAVLLDGTGSAGYIGIKNLDMQKVSINGAVAINVATMALPIGNVPMVTFAIANGTSLSVDSIKGTVALSTTQDLAVAGELGNIYVGAAKVTMQGAGTVKGQSMIQIFAH